MQRQVHGNGVVTWAFAMDDADVLAAVSTRHGGVSTGPYASLDLALHVGDDEAAVLENRARLCKALGVDRVTLADQQHGTRVAVVGPELAGAGFASLADAQARLGATDALVTDVPGVALGILVADCAPVALLDRVHGAVGVAHAGRAGVVADVLGATVRTMADRYGTAAEDLEVGIGPCIGAGAYEIGGEALDDARAALGDDLLEPTRPGHARFDLLGGVLRRLTEAGVPPDRIESAGTTTDAEPSELFSDRAARPCGRQLLVAALRTA